MFKISKRDDLSRNKIVLIRIFAILAAIVFSGLFILAIGFSPIEVFANMIKGAIGKSSRIEETIVKTIPLVITSLGILVAFKMKFWNIGGEGQIMMGALCASFIALNLPDLPRPVMLIAMAAAGIAGGGVWAFIPAFFKVKFGTNETIFTLMLNYIAIKYVTYLQFGPWKDPNAFGFPKIANFGANAVFPKLLGIHIGWLIALILVVLIYIFMTHTKKGYEIAVVGESVDTARYAGMNINGIIMIAMLISGGLCGLAGMIQASAVEQTLSVSLSGGYGFTAIITTWLSALKAPYVLVSSFAFAILIQGGTYIQTALQIPHAASNMIQGMILFFILGSEFFIQYKISFNFAANMRNREGR